MARILSLLPSALIATANNQGIEDWIKTMQSIGMGARKSEMRELYRLARGITNASPQEPFRDITAVPTASEITPWPTRKATGFTQSVTLVYRDRTTGTLAQTYWRTRNDQPIVRETAMAQAVSAYADHADAYNQDLIGAVHTSTYQNMPISDQAA